MREKDENLTKLIREVVSPSGTPAGGFESVKDHPAVDHLADHFHDETIASLTGEHDTGAESLLNAWNSYQEHKAANPHITWGALVNHANEIHKAKVAKIIDDNVKGMEHEQQFHDMFDDLG